MIRVFVSSVSKGLVPVRQLIINQLRTAGYDVGAMEFFGAQIDPPLDACLSELRKSDVIVLIVGPRYGSVLPQGVSYTQAEFREARSLGIPVLAFRIPDDANLAQEETDNLHAFLTEVGSTATYKALTQDDALESLSGEILAALNAARERGQLGSRFSIFQPFDQFFAHQLGSNRSLFNHEGPFVGRDEELARIEAFLNGDATVLLIKAPGGSGKSRLLLEVAKRSSQIPTRPTILFADVGGQWSTEDINQLPTLPLVIVIDDAHRRPDLDRLIFACLQRNPDCRLIVSCRPSALGIVLPHVSKVSRTGDIALVDLPVLDVGTATELAKHHLGPDLIDLAPRLVQIADRNPLVIAVGGRCIADKKVAPDVLQHTPEAFRNLVLDRLLEDPGLHGDDAPVRRKLLEIMAAVGPIAVEGEELVGIFSRFIGAATYEVRKFLAELERAGFLNRRGRLLRVSPDVLADHLLYTAAVDELGQPTGFVDLVVREFAPGLLENILANAAELDWRASATGQHESVLATTWANLLTVLPQATHAERAHFLKSIRRAAIFAPEQVLQLAEWIADHRDAPPNEKLRAWGFDDSFDQALDPLIDLFALLAQHPDFTERCAERLWQFAVVDDRPTNLNTSHPQRHLENLLKYDSRAGWQAGDSVQVRVIEFFVAKLNEAHDDGDRSWALRTLGTALSRIGEANESNREGFTFGQFSLAEFESLLAERRELVVKCLGDVAFGTNAVEAAVAVRELSTLLEVPTGPFGAIAEPDELSIWQSEAMSAVSLIAETARSAPIDVIRFLARRALRGASRQHWPEIAAALDAALEETPATSSEGLFDLLIGTPYEEQLDDFDAEEQRELQLRDRAASDFWEQHKSAGSVVAALLAAESAIHSVAGHDGSRINRLLHSLISAKSEEAANVVDALTRAGEPGWRLLPAALFAMHKYHPLDALRRADELLEDKSEIVRSHVADSLRWIANDELSHAAILRIASRLSQDPSKSVKKLVPEILRRFRNTAADEALAVTVSIDWANDTDVAAAVFDILHPKYGLDPGRLKDEEIDELLRRIVTLEALDGRSAHDVLEFITFASARRPESTVQTLIQRVLASDSHAGKRGRDRWTPIPHGSHWLSLRGLEKADDYSGLLRQIRDAQIGAGVLAKHWLPKLFRAAVSDSPLGLDVLREWVRSNDPVKIVAAAHLLRGFDHSIVFTCHEFIAELLDAAAKFGQDCVREAKSELFAVSISGVHSSAPGKPAPRHLSDKASAQVLMEKYASRKAVREFYEGLILHAESSIKRDMLQWEEEGDE